MNYRSASLAVSTVVLAAALAVASEPVEPDGLMIVDPPAGGSCVALRVAVGAQQALAGITWHGAPGLPFSRVLVAPGGLDAPPSLAEAQVIAENVAGVGAWQDLAFPSPIASQTGSLYVIFEYPAGIADQADAPSVGYAVTESPQGIHISADGSAWTPVSARYRLLVEPTYCAGTPGPLALAASGAVVVPAASPGLTAFPNPFNPQVRIELRNLAGRPVEVSVWDLQGHRVRTLYQGAPVSAQETVSWDGRDGHGRRQGSGVYFIRATGRGVDLTSRAVLVK